MYMIYVVLDTGNAPAAWPHAPNRHGTPKASAGGRGITFEMLRIATMGATATRSFGSASPQRKV